MKKQSLNLKFWFLYHIGMLVFSLFVAMLTSYNQTGNLFVPETILQISIVFTLSVLTGYIAIFLTNKAKKMSHEKLTKSILPGFLIFLVIIYVIANLVVSTGVFVWYVVHDKDLVNFLPNLFKYELKYANKSLFVWFMSFAIVFFYFLWRKSAKKEQQLREEKLKYQYQTLKAQLNPHFLFNSFNALSELIYEDPQKADRFIQRLSNIYRYILKNEENKLIPIEEEIDFVKEYFDLLKERDEDKIILNIDYESIKGLQIIPISIQLLVENAVKHNSKSKAHPLEIKIGREDDHIVVSNNIQKKNIIVSTTKLGLDNLRERTKLIADKELIVTEDKNKFVVKLPIIN